MLAVGRIPDDVLAEILGRLGIALGAGLDLRKAWALEQPRVPARWRGRMARVAAALADGEPLAAGMRAAGGFPPLVCSLVAVGDHTGHEAEVLRDVAAALADSVRSRRQLRAELSRPLFQFFAAMLAVGVLILVAGGIRDLDGRPVDILGLGLVGWDGLTTFATGLAAAVAGLVVLVPLAIRSWNDRGLVRWPILWTPVLGPAAAKAEAAAWCRTAALANHAGLDPVSLVNLASAAAPGLRMNAEQVAARLRGGAAFDEALAAARRLSPDVLETVALGEATGTLAESLDRLAKRLDEEARAGFTAAIKVVGFLAWAAVAALAALIVFRFFSFYVSLIRDAGKPI